MTQSNRAKLLEKWNQADGNDNPSTKMHKLVEYLKNLVLVSETK